MITTITHTSEVADAEARNRLSLGGMVHSEWIIAVSLRSVRWSIAVSVAVGVGLSLLMAFGMRDMGFVEVDLGAANVSGTDLPATIISFPAAFLCLVFAVLGVFMFSSEYSSGMILSTLAAAPTRNLLLTAKALVTVFISAAAATANVVAAALIAITVLPELRVDLFAVPALTGMLGTVLYLVAVSLMSFAFAGIFRSTAGGTTAAIGVLFVLPILFQMLAGWTDWEWVGVAAQYLPTSLGATVGFDVGDGAQEMLGAMGSDAPGYGLALCVLGLWALVPLVAAGTLFSQRDAK